MADYSANHTKAHYQTTPMKTQTREKLMRVSVASLCTLLYKRGLAFQTIQNVHPLRVGRQQNMVGPAFTLRYIPARHDRNQIDVFKNPQHPQRVAIETCPEGAVLVIDSRKDARCASAGDILITRLMMRGGAGIVTDGGLRDAMNIAKLDMPSYHQRPSSPTNLTNNEAIEINGPIGCGDVAIFPGDIVVGDDDSVIVIPQEIADDVADEAIEMTIYEEFVIERVKQGHSIIGLYPRTEPKNLELFLLWRQQRYG